MADNLPRSGQRVAIQVAQLFDTVVVDLGTSSARNSSPLKKRGIYRLSASVDCFIKRGGSSVVATTSDAPLWAKTYLDIFMMDKEYIAGIVATGTGKLYITEIFESR